jgi:hypothetical protein
VLPWLVLGILATILVASIGTSFFTDSGKTAVLFLIAGAWIIITILVVPWQSLAVLYLIDGVKTGVGIKEAYAKAWKKILRYWWLMVLNGLIVTGAFIPLIVPGIILSVSFSFALFVLAFEETGGLKAMLISRKYVAGRWWAVVGRQMYIGLACLVIMLPLTILVGLLSGGNKEVADKIEGLVNLLSLPLTPLILTYMYLIYKNLKSITQTGEVQIKNKFGWSLLAVWGMIGPTVVMGATLLAVINPLKQLFMSKNTQTTADVTRKNNQVTIQSALENYFRDNQEYPDEISTLMPEYLPGDTIQDIFTAIYTYTPAADRKTYELCVMQTDFQKSCVENIPIDQI